MYEVGNLWKYNKLDIGSEHVATNTAMRIIDTITSRTKIKPNAKTILICTPVGEYHLLPCLMMETFLLQIGYKVNNLAPSAPTKSITKYILENKPDLVLISITLKDNRNSAKRLLRELTKLKIPILIGGQAVQNGDEFGNAKVLGSPKMTQLSKIIKKEIG
jgi:methanogenic corrinoid protein MtbC1